MTAASATAGTFEPAESRLRRLLAGPAEGWLTLGGVALMIVTLCWSIDDAKWVRGVGSLTDFLPTLGLGGVLVGFSGPKLGWGRWTTHLIGVAFAAVLLPIVAGESSSARPSPAGARARSPPATARPPRSWSGSGRTWPSRGDR